MSNLVFPTLAGLSLPVQRSAIWKTRVVEADSGRRYAQGLWSYPRWAYKLKFDVLRSGAEAELQALVGFFNRHGGDADTWLFRDPDGRQVVDQPLGVADGVRTQWQAVRSSGGFTEPLRELDGAPAVKVNGTPQAVTYGEHTGLLTFASAPAAGAVLTWSGAYFLRCRFDKSSMDAEKFMQDLWRGDVSFTTEK